MLDRVEALETLRLVDALTIARMSGQSRREAIAALRRQAGTSGHVGAVVNPTPAQLLLMGVPVREVRR